MQVFSSRRCLFQVTASDSEANMQPRTSEMKPGISAPHPYQTSGTGVHSVGMRTADPSSRGGEFEGRGYHDSDGRKSGGDVVYRQFDHTTIDREVVIFHCSGSTSNQFHSENHKSLSSIRITTSLELTKPLPLILLTLILRCMISLYLVEGSQ